MRKCRLQRLVLAAAVVGAVSVLSLPWYADADSDAGPDTAVSQVDWVNADETYPIPPGSPTPSPSYDGDGTSDPDGGEGEDGGGDGDGHDGDAGPSGDGASPSAGPVGSENDSDGILGLAFPVQAGMSVGLLALAFLALLPGRRMPADLR
ncbi:hypothetical protein LO763_09030 [Glycomyces sp. A-F 0318]|uniref:hypothetical protein n=1 Tax=Glycomyces amatae TaxID=2881355 RepID=UPI001E5AC17E|nr:hypothetical protein [Glycomyces amatae]MCD0443764.1 hypothetical protein [Glycomyces amatae]